MYVTKLAAVFVMVSQIDLLHQNFENIFYMEWMIKIHKLQTCNSFVIISAQILLWISQCIQITHISYWHQFYFHMPIHQDRQESPAAIWTHKAGRTMKECALLGLKSQHHQIQATVTLFLETKMKLESLHWFLLICSIHYLASRRAMTTRAACRRPNPWYSTTST